MNLSTIGATLWLYVSQRSMENKTQARMGLRINLNCIYLLNIMPRLIHLVTHY